MLLIGISTNGKADCLPDGPLNCYDIHAHIRAAREDCACEKRVVVCLLFDGDGRIVGRGSNQCCPSQGVCANIGLKTRYATYRAETPCRSVHAEAIALASVKDGDVATTAIVIGHDFVCPACESLLTGAGIPPSRVKVIPERYGCGLRHKENAAEPLYDGTIVRQV